MKKLIISADDFGYSESVNQAIILAHREGILTSASLMVTGEALESAIQLAKENPRLAVGLHLVLICGKSVLPHSEIPDLVNTDKNFSNSPTLAGMQYYFDGNSRVQLEMEIKAQFQKFKETGLICVYVDSHLHMHINPTILDILLRVGKEFGVTAIRIPADDLALALQFDKSHYISKRTHHLIFNRLSWQAKQKAKSVGFRFTDKVYGLYQTGDMNSSYTEHLLRHLSEGISEIYYHPDFNSWYDFNQKTGDSSENDLHLASSLIKREEGKGCNMPNTELKALLDPQIKQFITQNGIDLITYKDL